ncbi:MAG TPA: thioredoxin domain-containing protein, partial [Candidatus Limnocylindrales bacterium]|nr:thioredoxin domain-containing protein [Candidatus Limnocylindrales bacterium]
MSSRNRGLVLLGGIVLIAIAAIAVVVLVSNNEVAATTLDVSQIPFSRGEDGAFILGDPDAPVTIIEFADFACPHCVDYERTIEQFITQYVATGQARLEYRMFPTAGGDLTRFAGQIAECADQQRPGAFWEAYVLLYQMARTGQYNQDLGQKVATQLDLNYAEILNCSTTAQQVATDVAFGRARSISGTPAVMVRFGDGAAQYITINGQTYDRGS